MSVTPLPWAAHRNKHALGVPCASGILPRIKWAPWATLALKPTPLRRSRTTNRAQRRSMREIRIGSPNGIKIAPAEATIWHARVKMDETARQAVLFERHFLNTSMLDLPTDNRLNAIDQPLTFIQTNDDDR